MNIEHLSRRDLLKAAASSAVGEGLFNPLKVNATSIDRTRELSEQRPETEQLFELGMPLTSRLGFITESGGKLMVEQNGMIKVNEGDSFTTKAMDVLHLGDGETSTHREINGLQDGRVVISDVVINESEGRYESRIGVLGHDNQIEWQTLTDREGTPQIVIGKTIPGENKTVHLVRVDGKSGFTDSRYYTEEFDPDTHTFSRKSPSTGTLDANSIDEITSTEGGYEVIGRRLALMDFGDGVIGQQITGVSITEVSDSDYRYKPIDYLSLTNVDQLTLDESGKSFHFLTHSPENPRSGSIVSISTGGFSRTGSGYEYGHRIPELFKERNDNYGGEVVYIAQAKSVGSTVWLGGILRRQAIDDQSNVYVDHKMILFPLHSENGHIDPAVDPKKSEIILVDSPYYKFSNSESDEGMPYVADIMSRPNHNSIDPFDRELLVNVPYYGVLNLPLDSQGKQNGPLGIYNEGL